MDPPGPQGREEGIIIKSVSCRFAAPVKFPDTLFVGARIASIGDDRVIMKHAAFSQKLQTLIGEKDRAVLWRFIILSGLMAYLENPAHGSRE